MKQSKKGKREREREKTDLTKFMYLGRVQKAKSSC